MELNICIHKQIILLVYIIF